MLKNILFSVLIIVLISFLFGNTINAQWTQIGNDIDGEATEDEFGYSVSLSSDGSIVAIGAYMNDGGGQSSGHVRVYENVAGNWTQKGNDIDGEANGDYSGNSVSLNSDGSTVAIGAQGNNGIGIDVGHVRVYEYNGSNWIQIGNDIDGEADDDNSGHSVSLNSDGSTVAIGAQGNNGIGIDVGHVRVYEYNGSNWIQIGNDIDGEANGDYSGHSVSLSSDGSIVAIGAYMNDGNGTNAGHVRVYENIGGNWIQIGNDIDSEASGDNSGYSVSLSSDGSIVAIGAPFNNGNGTYVGHVRVYENIGGNWTQIGNDIDGEADDDWSGHSVNLNSDGSIVAIGTPYNDDNGNNSGHVRVYEYNGSNWVQVGSDIDGEASGDELGNSVSLSSDGSIVAIGAHFNNGIGFKVGHVRVFNNPTLGININSPNKNISIYPNPTTGKIRVNKKDIQKIEIIDIHGKQIYIGNTNEIDISKQSKGIYFIKVITQNGVGVKKVILE